MLKILESGHVDGDCGVASSDVEASQNKDARLELKVTSEEGVRFEPRNVVGHQRRKLDLSGQNG